MKCTHMKYYIEIFHRINHLQTLISNLFGGDYLFGGD